MTSRIDADCPHCGAGPMLRRPGTGTWDCPNQCGWPEDDEFRRAHRDVLESIDRQPTLDSFAEAKP